MNPQAAKAEAAFLIERWGLPPAAAPLIEALSQAWSRGDTALKLEKDQAAILEGPALSRDGQPAPLVLKDGLLQSWRHHEAEGELARILLGLAQAPERPGIWPAVAQALEALPEEKRLGQDQRAALELGLKRRLLLVVGGPGTGKSSSVGYLLAARLLAQPKLKVALAAPTAKAAANLGSAVLKLLDTLPGELVQSRTTLEGAAKGQSTLHTLLQYNPGEGRCKRNAENPLEADLVVVDEASMVDLQLWRALLAALKPEADLIVLGDPDQLVSVEVGAVLGVLVASAQAGGPLAGCLARLRQNFRSRDYPGLVALAEAVLSQDPKAVEAASPVQTGEKRADAEGLRAFTLEQALDKVWPSLKAIAGAPDEAAALLALKGFQGLCALNQGDWGVAGFNQAVEARLQKEFGGRRCCQPVQILENDPHTGLKNGELGILWPESGGRRAVFEQGTGSEAAKGAKPAAKLRSFPEAKLPAHALAWGISIHKAQGSEAKTVLVVLPPADKLSDNAKQLLTTQLLYTAVTRARERLVLAADAGAIALACGQKEERVMGLEGRLKGAEAAPKKGKGARRAK